VPDFTTKLELISTRGTPVGAEELIERIEAQLGGDPLIVVTSRRKGAVMTKTDQPTTTRPPGTGRGLIWALAAFVAVLAVAGIYLATSGDDEVADTTPTTLAEPTPTTAAPVESTADLETIEAGVAAFYSGDADRAAELFELPDRTDQQIREEAAYQAAIDGRLGLDCIDSTPGTFHCRVPYHNAMTDAIGYTDQGDTNRVVVEDGVITEFAFPEHSWMVIGMGTFLGAEGRFEGYEDCGFAPFPESCAIIQLENLDAWVEWLENFDRPALVEAALQSWYGGDCQSALALSWISLKGGESWVDCSTSSSPAQTIEYESILGAEVTVENCEEAAAGPDVTNVTCEVHYSNVMSSAVGKEPSVMVREFAVHDDVGWVRQPAPEDAAWHEGDYPEDTELRASFQQFAEGGELAEAYAGAGCASTRSPDCANLIIANLDEWAAWYQTNN
jgi:hypothetical protein